MIYGWTCILGNSQNSWWFVTEKCSDLDTKPKVNNYITEMEHLIFQVLYLQAQSYVHIYIYISCKHSQYIDFTIWAYKHNN